MSEDKPRSEEELIRNLMERWDSVQANFTALSELVEKAQAVSPEEGADSISVDREMFLVLRGLADLVIGEAFLRLLQKKKAAESQDCGCGPDA